jgi:hypothetical protein
MSDQSKPVTIDEILADLYDTGCESGINEIEYQDAVPEALLAINRIVLEARIDESKMYLDMGEDLYYPYGHSDDVIKERIEYLTAHQYGLGE